MRTSATNTLRKAYGKFTKDLEKGNLRKRLESDVLSGKISRPFI